jgi:trehalose synthase
MMSVRLEAYREVAPRGGIELLGRLAERLRGRRFVHVNGSRFGAGSPEVLARLIPMLQGLGIEAVWEVVVGDPDSYAAIRQIERGLTGLGPPALPEAAVRAYREAAAANAAALHLEGDVVMVHDVAALPLGHHRPTAGRWVWGCHGDLSHAHRRVWNVARADLERYDAAVFSLPRFAHRLPIPTLIVHPAVDPLSERNRDLSRAAVDGALARLGVPRDKPLVVQVAPYARSKDPLGVVRAYRLAKKYADCRLVLAGWGVNDNPEGRAVLDEVREAAAADPDVHPLVLPPDAGVELNALQRAAAVVMHKPLREDFGLAVAEAMWKGKPVVASAVGGLSSQVIPEVTGFTVTSVEGAAFRLRQLLEDPDLRARLGGAGREYVRRSFLVTRQLGDYLALLASLTG